MTIICVAMFLNINRYTTQTESLPTIEVFPLNEIQIETFNVQIKSCNNRHVYVRRVFPGIQLLA